MVELIYFTFKVPYSFKLQAEDSFRAPGRFLRLPHRVVFRVAERKIHDRDCLFVELYASECIFNLDSLTVTFKSKILSTFNPKSNAIKFLR